MTPRFEFHPATAERWADVEKLFGPRGACAGCWCMFPRLPRAEFHAGSGEPNRRKLRTLVRGGEEPGILAYANDEPVGWCALAPRRQYPRIEKSRLFGGAEVPAETWSVVCFFVARPFRRQGLTIKLLEAASRYARSRGARMLEGYPVEPRKPTADAFAWTGHAAAFRAAKFVEVARPSPTRPLMRRALARSRSAPRPAPRRSTARG